MNLPPTLCLMLKAPRPGFVKTRLASDLGNEAAAQVYRRLVEHQAAQVPREWRVEVHFTPADADAEMRAWLQPLLPTETTFFAQPDGDLGARLRTALGGAASRGANEILFAGGDCPELTTEKLSTAARALHSTPFVIIPATDGGYVLIGLAAPRFFIFDDIAWSTPHVFEQTRQRIQARGYDCHCFAPVEDVDDLHALRRARTHCPALAGFDYAGLRKNA